MPAPTEPGGSIPPAARARRRGSGLRGGPHLAGAARCRGCPEAGAHKVQIDVTEGRLSPKLDPWHGLRRSFIALNNRVLERFTPEERRRIGVHTCPGGDRDSTDSADVDCGELLPDLRVMGTALASEQLA